MSASQFNIVINSCHIKWWPWYLSEYHVVNKHCITFSSIVYYITNFRMFWLFNIQAPFDASSVDNMRRLVEHSGPPTHIYPMAILCHDIMPPPQKVWCSFLESMPWFFYLIFIETVWFCRLKKKLGRKELYLFMGLAYHWLQQ